MICGLSLTGLIGSDGGLWTGDIEMAHKVQSPIMGCIVRILEGEK